MWGFADDASVLSIKMCAEFGEAFEMQIDRTITCLLYTSDAADERSSVDLGGRRIIKKKKKLKIATTVRISTK